MRSIFVLVLAFVPLLALSEETPAAADAAAGKAIYEQTCFACHGTNGKGAIPGVPDLNSKSGPLAKADAELIKNISEGFQSPGSIMPMPAKGGNPALSADDVASVLAFIRAEFGT